MKSSIQIFDREEAENLRVELADNALFMQIADVFQTEARERLPEIIAAYEQRDLDLTAKKSHSIRSSAATLGCAALADQLKRIELVARELEESDWDQLQKEMEGLTDLVQLSLEYLENYRLALT